MDYQLMRRMGWDWEQLEACPVYVRNYVLDFLMIEQEAQQMSNQGGEVHRHNPDAWVEAADGGAD